MEFTTLAQLTEHFSDKQTCIDYLTNLRWAGNVTCTFCGNEKVYELKGATKRFKCAKCRKQFSAIKGTIFENSPISLQTWFIAVYILTAHKKGISSVQLATDLGVTQKTAWFMAHRIRFALKTKSFETQLDGVIQADETFMGGKNKNRHADKKVPQSQGLSVNDKTPFWGMVDNDGEVRTQVIPNTQAKTIKPIIQKMVKEGSILVTDEWQAYCQLRKNYLHIVINHKEGKYVANGFTTNRIEGFWSILKRGVYGIYHQVSAAPAPLL
ncbi:MAG: IS1595 family transposase [Saprospiraceae bacterium]|nr:IS1595 family transposase [Saprospiraceae bacterium]